MAEARVTPGLRREVADRARGCCEYCRSQERFAMQAFSVEHIDPRSRAGTTAAANLAYACQGCNNHKYNRTHGTDPATGEPVPCSIRGNSGSGTTSRGRPTASGSSGSVPSAGPPSRRCG
jgi:hypothetical protein